MKKVKKWKKRGMKETNRWERKGLKATEMKPRMCENN